MSGSSEERIDWELTTFEGNRRTQHLEFFALSFQEKLERLENFAEIEELFSRRDEGLR